MSNSWILLQSVRHNARALLFSFPASWFCDNHDFKSVSTQSWWKESKIIFVSGFSLTFLLTKCQNFRCFGVLPGGEFANWKKCAYLRILRRRIWVILSGSSWTWKLTPRSIIGLKKLAKPLTNTFPGSNWNVMMMQIEESEIYDKVL